MPANKRPVSVLFALVAGLVGGWLVAQLVRDGRVRPESSAAEVNETVSVRSQVGDPVRPERESSGSAATERPVAREAVEERTDAPAVTSDRERVQRELHRGWQEVRGEDMPPTALAEGEDQYAVVERDAPAEIGRQLAQRQDELDRAAGHGDAFTLVEEMLHGIAGERAAELAADGAAMSELFASRSADVTRDGRLFQGDLDAGIEDGTTLTFPAGVFRLDSLMETKDPFPRDVTVSGAGMDRTLLFISDLDVRTALVSFAIRDCTVHTDNAALMDLRREPTSMFFENVRFIGFDSGLGGSSLLECPSGVFLARGCRFESGYGRAPEHGALMDIRSDGVVARFERCTFERIEIEERFIRPGARVVFDGCTMIDLLDRRPLPESERLRLPGTTITYFDYQERRTPPRLDLDDLFPGWEDHLGG
jgi:hypothetical protein